MLICRSFFGWFGLGKGISLILIFVYLLSPFFVLLSGARSVEAYGIEDFQDVLSTSAPLVGANHLISYTSLNNATSGQTIVLALDPDTNAFDMSGLLFSDIQFMGASLVESCGLGTDEVTVTFTSNPDSVVFTVCSGDTVLAGSKSIVLGNERISNPASTGSYAITIGGTQQDSGETRVMIIDGVLMSANVDTVFLFSIEGVGQDESVNGDAVLTSDSSSSILLPFGVLDAGSPKVLAQDLFVSTNAQSGFVVTVTQDQNLSSTSGAEINLFSDAGTPVSTPAPWRSPTPVLGQADTYGHYGVTSEDDLNSNEFAGPLYAGNIDTPRQIFSHSSAADGVTPGIGSTRVGFKIEISALQQAGSDYTNNIYYVATPTF
jgi:hypothetical protein